MTEPRWYRENGNIYFADVGREGSLIWVPEGEWHTDERCEQLFQDTLNPPDWLMNFEWQNDPLEGK